MALKTDSLIANYMQQFYTDVPSKGIWVQVFFTTSLKLPKAFRFFQSH